MRPDDDRIARLARYRDMRLPRYTSYPTAAQFAPLAPETHRAWLEAVPAATPLSLYLHVPFCETLCWYCGCHTRAVSNPDPIHRYAATMEIELQLVGAILGTKRRATHIHWGGGTPSALGPGSFGRLMARLRQVFAIAGDAEIATEIDPRRLSDIMISAFAEHGVNRASIGVQSFDPRVQEAINRIQDVALTARAAKRLRATGIEALNVDLLYGLPFETAESAHETVLRVIDLDPDRVAVFGYAHVPEVKPHQRRIPGEALPDGAARAEQAERIAAALLASGYVRVGLDHFAKADDPMAREQGAGTLKRNFQGYTTDAAPALIGFGASSISRFDQGYAQNAVTLRHYREAVEAGRLATARGIALDAEDRFRAAIIEALMCDLAVDLERVARNHGVVLERVEDISPTLGPLIADGVACLDGPRLSVPEEHRALVRVAAAAFDAYLPTSRGTHAQAV